MTPLSLILLRHCCKLTMFFVIVTVLLFFVIVIVFFYLHLVLFLISSSPPHVICNGTVYVCLLHMLMVFISLLYYYSLYMYHLSTYINLLFLYPVTNPLSGSYQPSTNFCKMCQLSIIISMNNVLVLIILLVIYNE